ncbi:MAG: chromosome segregation protein SMC [FCB group bacterium]|nr:chromosome segregation protein SMC [FCB group bacterium]
MYLKKLELLGFKSFPEKTTFLFNEGITSIVGPNGCGKTNLLDALRWVLGEQKTSLLRGNKMEEVIFAGTRTLKPLGMAEVSLQLENRHGVLPSQYNELAIARRLFRSGESEYLLNKVPCRLKDITDLFADTGLGSHAYAIIQQDMIEAILSDKAEERRFLFEEAAGITKYKHRKQAAERKLEATEHDLQRLQDILSEVNTRVNSLKRQVNKARRYKTVSDELKSWELYTAGFKYEKLTTDRKELSVSMKSLEDKRLGVEAGLDSHFAELEKGRTTLTDFDHELTKKSSRVLELSEKAHQVETEISVNREKKENLTSLAAQNRDEIDALNKRAEVIRDEKGQSQNEHDQIGGEIERLGVELEQSLIRQRTADSEYLQFRSLADDENTKLLDLEGKISSGRTDSANIEEQTKDLQSDIETQNERRRNLTEEKSRRREKITGLQSQIDQVSSENNRLEESLAETEKNLEDSQTQNDQLRDNLAELSSGYEATLARKNLLAEMIEHYEGYGSGVVAVFEIANRWVDITGTVADFLRPHDGFRPAIEAALGDSAQYILCSNHQTAQEAITHLQDQKAGRATFLVLDRLTETNGRPVLPDIPGVNGWADSLIECDDRYKLVASSLLGRTAICDNGETALRLLDSLPLGYRVTTMRGEMYSRDGLITGGASEELSLIGRKDEIETLTQKLDELQGQISEIKEKQADTTLKIGQLRQTIAQANQKLAEDKDRLSDLNSSLKEEQFKINAADEVVTSIDQRMDQLSQKLDNLKNRQYTLALDFDQLDQQKATIAAQVRSKRERLEELEKGTHDATEEVNRLQMATVEQESKRSHHASQITYYEEMLTDIASNIELKNGQIGEAETTSGELIEIIRSDEVGLKELFEEREQETATQQELRQRHDDQLAGVDELEKQVKILRREKDQIGDEIHQADISLTEVNSRLEQLEERTSSEYETDIRELKVESPNAELSEEQISTHMDDLQEKLRRMGIVNLLALEEYDQQKSRQEFLSKQLDDLITAKSTLRSTIQKINQTARMMFLETLEQARANFKQMYEELFTGGEADIILVDPSNPLESPIEIISRPRGKKPLTITQLSGGERALTAISLLFALYMVKPSPFCFLDEIDAPLDDVNVGRFLTIVRKFSRQTQFIIITHNKITMEAANSLYGVTMEEPGVSKVVAVRFKKDEEEADTILDMHYAEDDNLTQAG